MSTLFLEDFEQIYNDTYNYTLRYILCKCSNIDDINDLIQETYVELYKVLQRKKYIVIENYQNYIIGIAKKKIQKYYGLLYKVKASLILNNIDYKEYELEIPANINIEMDIITKSKAEEIWKYIKQKNTIVIKVFYLYYYLELKISEIANELNISESNVKNILYRTIKEIKKNIKIEGDLDV